MIEVTWVDIQDEAERLAARWPDDIESVYGVPAGGAPVACLVARHLGVSVVDQPGRGTLVVDDLVDSGATLARYENHHTDALFRKPHSPVHLAPHARTLDGWLAFPWEHDQAPTDSVTRILQHIGEDPTREGLVETPRRFLSALTEATAGHDIDVGALLSVQFDEKHDQMVVLSGIEFASLCEHHLSPFRGVVTVGYIPSNRVVGLSKLARVVEAFARRLQVQERMTDQIADALNDYLEPVGVGVVVTAHHTCMGNRGVRKHQAEMTTSSMSGALRHDTAARAEFLAMSHLGG